MLFIPDVPFGNINDTGIISIIFRPVQKNSTATWTAEFFSEILNSQFSILNSQFSMILALPLMELNVNCAPLFCIVIGISLVSRPDVEE
jgi:hypothetical protein